MTSLSIIILSYKTKELTLQCLDSVISNYEEQLRSGEFEIIVVDNGSTDGTVKQVQSSKFKVQSLNSKLKIIENRENVGFAKGINIGAKQAKGKYLFFLNSDAQLKDNKLIKMIKFLDEHSEVGILGARMINEDGSQQRSFGKFYNLFNFFLMIVGGERLGMIRINPVNIAKVDWVSGGAMMVKSEVFKSLGGFDENFFMYVEDMELCFRAKKMGFLTFYYPSIEIVHKGLGSSNREYAILSIYKGICYFYKKHRPYWEYLIVLILLKTKAIMVFYVGVVTNNSFLKNTYRKALKI